MSEVKLGIKITADSRAATDDIKRVETALGGVGNAASVTAEELQRATLAGAAIGSVLGVVGLSAVTHLGGMATASLHAADAMNDLHLRTGESLRNLAAYDLMARQSGTSIDGVATGIRQLSRFMVEHGDKLASIGVTATDTNAAMRQFADVIAKTEDPALRTALAVEVLGRNGTQLLPLLVQGAAGFEEAATKTEAYGAAMERVAPLADTFNDQLAVGRIHAETLGLQITGAVLPALIHLNDYIGDSVGKTGEFNLAASTARTVMEALAVTGANVAYVIKTIVDDMVAFGQIVKQVATLDVDGALSTKLNRQKSAQEARAAIDALEQKILSGTVATQAATKADADHTRALEAKIRTMVAGGAASKKAADTESDFANQSARLIKQAEKELADMKKARDKAEEDETKSREAALKAGEAYLTQIDARASAMEKEVENYGKTESAIELTTLARLKEARELAVANGAWPEHLAFLDREIAARQRLAGAAGQKEVLDANKKAAEDSARTWEKISGDISRNLTDSIFGGGKSAGEMLKDWFKTLVLAPMVSMATQPISNAVGSALGFNTGSASGAGGVGNMISGANSAYNIYTGATGATVGNAVSWFGNATGSTATSAFGSGISAASGGADLTGAIAAYQEATITAAGAGDAAAAAAYSEAAAGLAEGAGAAAAIPYIGWAIAAIALIASLSGKGGGPKTEGDALYNLTGGTPTYAGSEGFFTGNSGDAFAQQITGATAAATTDMLKALGGSGSGVGVRLGFNTDPQGSAPDNITGNVTRADGSYAYLHTYDAGRGDYASALQLEAKRVMLAAIGASDVNAAYKSIVNSVDLMTASAEQLDQAMTDVNNVHAILQFGTADPFAAYADSLESAGNSYLAQLDKQRAAVTAAAAAYNGSTTSINALAAATQQRYQMEIALAKQLDDLVKSSSSMYAGGRREIEMAGLDARGKYDYYDAETRRYRDVLATLTTEADIQEYRDKLYQSTMSAFGTLDESQQAVHKTEFLARLDDQEKLVNDRIAAVKDNIKTDNQQLQTDIATAIDKAMSAAADKIAAAASIPQTVNVVSSFNLSGLFSGAEVGGWEAAGG